MYFQLIFEISTPKKFSYTVRDIKTPTKFVFSNIKENHPQKSNPSSINNQIRYYFAKSKEQIPKP